jgi:hypothetical protein
MNRVYGFVNRVHRIRCTSLWSSLNASHWNCHRRLRLGRMKWYRASNLECWLASRRLRVTPARGWRSGRRRGRPAAVAHWSWSYMALRASVFNEIFTYNIEAMWQTYFAHLGMTASNDGDWRRRGSSAQAWCQCRWSLGLLRRRWKHQRGRRSSAKLLGQLD